MEPGELRRVLIFLVAVAAAATAYYFISFAGERDENYIFWDATVTFVWIDASEATKDYGVGRGRYEVRLPNGRHAEARTYLSEKFLRFDCVRVRQVVLSITAPTNTVVRIRYQS